MKSQPPGAWLPMRLGMPDPPKWRKGRPPVYYVVERPDLRLVKKQEEPTE